MITPGGYIVQYPRRIRYTERLNFSDDYDKLTEQQGVSFISWKAAP
jgi:hypothetical protein